jgi:uncharacterized protein YaaQ
MAIAVIGEDDAGAALEALRERGFRVTTIASSGGLLRKGKVTLLLGFPEWREDEALRLLRERCCSDCDGAEGPCGAVYVLATDRFEQLG